MEKQDNQPTLIQHALKWALILGGVSIANTILLYAVDYTLMVLLKTLLVSLLVYFGLAIYAGINYRNSIGGFLPYGKAFQHGLMVLAISGLVSTIFSLLLYTVIDPELPQKLTDASIENTREIMQNFNAPEDAIDKALDDAKKRGSDQFSVKGLATGYLTIIVFSAIMALISAIFVKKNQPVEV